ncbi:MAG TPA: hypothetical protein DCZ40_10945 [Lachnospiraceae bacterium]|nr:hypothetical protein [Lachnospiraceae bacterium]
MKEVFRIIENTEDDGMTKVITYLSPYGIGHEVNSRESFWDVVGDELLSDIVNCITTSKKKSGICYLVPGRNQAEGQFYSAGILKALLKKSASDGEWDYVLFNVSKGGIDYGIPTLEWEGILEKERLRQMAGSIYFPSFEDFKKKSGLGKSEIAVKEDNEKQWEELPSLRDYAKEKGTGVSISPLAGGNEAKVSMEARRNALEFAHPIDQSIIKTLDSPAINAVFNKIVQTGIDANYGLALATGIHVSRNAYKQLYEIVVDCAKELGIPIPYVIISDSVHGLNACTAGTNQFSFIAISTMLPVIFSPEEMKFVIGHECGHLALGHVVYHSAISMMGAAGGLLPLVGPIIEKTLSYPLNAWSRRSEISADRAGLICCGNIDVAKRALMRLEGGLLNIDNIDIDDYVRESERMLDSTDIGKFAEFNMQHPIIPKRIKALDLFSKSAMYGKYTGQPIDGDSLSWEQLEKETEKVIEVM